MNPGTSLEQAVFHELRRLIATGALGLTEEYSQVFLNKGYYSRDRRDFITMDVSIELTTLGSKEPSIVWIWECKNYSNPVPVDDVEEFHAKLGQIGSDRTKGTMITTSSYQKAAIEFALSQGIGLVRAEHLSHTDGNDKTTGIRLISDHGFHAFALGEAARELAIQNQDTTEEIASQGRPSSRILRPRFSIQLQTGRHTGSFLKIAILETMRIFEREAPEPNTR